ncbi:hypothetical protein PO124_17165 [Bacillus licheniformis]|nr:hypothetical protein [Bacillus licheniformis]
MQAEKEGHEDVVRALLFQLLSPFTGALRAAAAIKHGRFTRWMKNLGNRFIYQLQLSRNDDVRRIGRTIYISPSYLSRVFKK